MDSVAISTHLFDLGTFLSYYNNQPVTWVLEGVARRDGERLAPLVETFSEYGAVHLLGQVTEAVAALLPAQLDWWLSTLGEAGLYPSVLRRFLAAHRPFQTSYAQAMEALWHCLPADPFALPAEGDRAWLCLLLPGLYQRHLDVDYLHRLNRLFFPQLRALYGAETQSGFDPLRRALLLSTLRIATGELGWRSFNACQSLSRLLLRPDLPIALPREALLPLVAAHMRNAEALELCTAPGWAEGLAFLADAAQAQGIDPAALDWVAPFALQLAGQEDRGAERLLHVGMLEGKLTVAQRSYGVFLLACARGLLYAGPGLQGALHAYYDSLFSVPFLTLSFRAYGAVAAEIGAFYRSFARKAHIPALSTALEEAYAVLTNEALPFTARLAGVSDFDRLFGRLTSHREQGISGIRLLARDWLAGYPDEVFGLYTPQEVALLDRLAPRLEAASARLPDASALALTQNVQRYLYKKDEAQLLSWERFAFLHENKTQRFEQMCRRLVLAEYAAPGQAPVWCRPHHPGVEFAPVRGRDGKRLSLQAKFFTGSVDHAQLQDSAEKMHDLDTVYLYCNKDIDQESKRFLSIQQALAQRGITLIPVCNEAVFDQLRAHPEIACDYFYHEKHQRSTTP